MSLTLIDGGLPRRMTYGEWLTAHPEAMPHRCPTCGHEMLAETCDGTPWGRPTSGAPCATGAITPRAPRPTSRRARP